MTRPGARQAEVAEVQIMGQGYVLACPAQGEDALRAAVAKVDATMCRIRDAGKVKARDRIAVLAALNIAFELLQQDEPGSSGAGAASAEFDGLSGPLLNPAQAAQLQQLLTRLDAVLLNDGSLF